ASAPAPSSSKLLAGKYQMIRALGAGGMGTVYEAINERTRRRVAIKVLHAAFSSDSNSIQRFMQEAQSASRIAHPNVVDILDLGEDPDTGAHFMVQEFLTGTTLRQQLAARGRFSVGEAIEVIAPAIGALVVAHEAGVVHRDIKPENIFVAKDLR